MWPEFIRRSSLWQTLWRVGAPVTLSLLGQLNHPAAHAQAWTAAPLCNIDTTIQDRVIPNSPHEPEDCIEFGAAVGELGWSWRQKLPSHVRWINRQDAASLCQQAQTEWGQKVGPLVATGCIFLAPDACTIITPGHISAALLSNAIRHCAP